MIFQSLGDQHRVNGLNLGVSPPISVKECLVILSWMTHAHAQSGAAKVQTKYYPLAYGQRCDHWWVLSASRNQTLRAEEH